MLKALNISPSIDNDMSFKIPVLIMTPVFIYTASMPATIAENCPTISFLVNTGLVSQLNVWTMFNRIQINSIKV